MAANEDIVIEQGATFEKSFTIENTNLSSYLARAQGRTSHASGTIAITFTAAITYLAPNSTITLSLTASQTAALTAPSCGVFDVEAYVGATVIREVEGSYTITPEVTR